MRKIQVELKYFTVLTVFLLAYFPFASFSDASFEQCKANILPSYINNSMYWGEIYGPEGGRAIYEAFKELSPPSILIGGSGNNAPDPVGFYRAQASKDFDMIIVGSLNTDGKRSSFSQEGEEVHIMAPSGTIQTSSDGEGNYKKFGWTSGAAPLVTGSLAGFEWFSGYHPTSGEAKILLEKTAIPTSYSKNSPRTNGVGMVNAYKLGMVGKRLKKICGQNKSCIKGKIHYDPSIYNFPEDSSLPEALDQAFPECRSDTGSCSFKSSSLGLCSNKEYVFKRLRKAVFLDPSNNKLWRYLACIYKSNGFDENAKGAMEFYKNSVFPDGVAYCKTDADCVLVPRCRGMSTRGSPFNAMTKTDAEISYMTRTCKYNGKCRFGNEETVKVFSSFGSRHSSTEVHSSRCVEHRCVLKVTQAKEEENPASEEKRETTKSPSRGSE